MSETTNVNTYTEYTKNNWTDDSTMLSAENLNKIETGLEDASAQIVLLDQAVKSISEDLLGSEEFEAIQEAIEDQLDWNTEYAGYHSNLQSEVAAISSTLSAHTGDSNPHGITARSIGAYDSEAVDAMFHPIAEVSGSGSGFIDIESCENISQVAHNIRLDLESNDIFEGNQLWDIIEDASTQSCVASALNTSAVTDLLSSNWQQIDGVAEDLVLNKAALQNFTAIPDSKLNFTNNFAAQLTTAARVVLVLYNETFKRYYLADMGEVSELSTVVNNNILFVKLAGANKKCMLEIPESAQIKQVFVSNTVLDIPNFSVTIFQGASLESYTFELNDNNGQVAYSDEIYQAGSYLIPYSPTYSEGAQEFNVGGKISSSGTNINLSYKLSYFKNDTRLNEMFKLSPDIETINRNIETRYEKELQRLVTVGTADPDGSTPGLIYFKYLQ
jgi:hypothetical protein